MNSNSCHSWSHLTLHQRREKLASTCNSRIPPKKVRDDDAPQEYSKEDHVIALLLRRLEHHGIRCLPSNEFHSSYARDASVFIDLGCTPNSHKKSRKDEKKRTFYLCLPCEVALCSPSENSATSDVLQSAHFHCNSSSHRRNASQMGVPEMDRALRYGSHVEPKDHIIFSLNGYSTLLHRNPGGSSVFHYDHTQEEKDSQLTVTEITGAQKNSAPMDHRVKGGAWLYHPATMCSSGSILHSVRLDVNENQQLENFGTVKWKCVTPSSKKTSKKKNQGDFFVRHTQLVDVQRGIVLATEDWPGEVDGPPWRVALNEDDHYRFILYDPVFGESQPTMATPRPEVVEKKLPLLQLVSHQGEEEEEAIRSFSASISLGRHDDSSGGEEVLRVGPRLGSSMSSEDPFPT